MSDHVRVIARNASEYFDRRWGRPRGRGRLRAGNQIEEPFADVPVAVIDPADIAAVAVASLLTTHHLGATYRLTGPEALYPADRARILASVLKRHCGSGPERPHRPGRLTEQMEPPHIDALFRSGRYGEATPSDVLPKVTGRPATAFEQWASEHASAFSGKEGSDDDDRG